jgi:hypothetical protein
MTITIAWLRRKKATVELVMASDSRLRSHGALDQAQKLFRLDRGDCCLAFCGDAQVAYPLFIQVGTTLNNFIKTRTRAEDITHLSGLVGQVLNNLIGSWDLPEREKAQELRGTRILFGGWSWENRRFDIGYFAHENGGFRFHHQKAKKPHPWHERERSLVFIGYYEADYMQELKSVLERRHPTTGGPGNKVAIDFDYEPVEALQSLLARTAGDALHPAIGGAAQMVKVYPYGNTLPFVVRPSADSHFLLGRKLFDWEKTEYPVLDLTGADPVVHYPMRGIPLPRDLVGVEAADD